MADDDKKTADKTPVPKARRSSRVNKGIPPNRYGEFMIGIHGNSTKQRSAIVTESEDSDDELDGDPEDTTLMQTMVSKIDNLAEALSTSVRLVAEEQQKLRDDLEMLKDDAKKKAPVKHNQPPKKLIEELAPPSRTTVKPAQVMFEHKRKIYDLPAFSGQAEEWPLFKAAFDETTEAYGYSLLENMTRLRKALVGEAERTVKSLLIHPKNVNEVMEELEFRFGRSDLLVRSQLEMIRKFPAIRDYELHKLIEFSTVTKNLVSFLENAEAANHLSNPMLVDEMVAKLPLARKYEWANFVRLLGEQPSAKHFANWLKEVARTMALLTTPTLDRPSPSGRKVMLQTTERRSQCGFCNGEHETDSCKELLAKDVEGRWNWIRQARGCFSCLERGHMTSNCQRRQRCGIGGCQMHHHKLLHYPHERREHGPADLTKISLHTRTSSETLFKVVPVTLVNGDESVDTFALLDDGSSVTLVDQELADELQLHGQEDNITLQWFNHGLQKQKTLTTSCSVKGQSTGSRLLSLQNVRTIKNLKLPVQTVTLDDLQHEFPDIMSVPVQSYSKGSPKLLIGLDNAFLLTVTQCRPSESGRMNLAETPLGWIVYGSTSEPTRVGNVLLIDSSYDLDEAERMHEVEQLLQGFFDTENCALLKPTPKHENSDITRARKILSETTERIGKRFQTGLLWKVDDVQLPDSRGMAIRRLMNLEKKLEKSPDTKRLYHAAIHAYLDKGYARILFPEEVPKTSTKTWYLPHFGVVNPSKPGKIRVVFDSAAKVNGVSLNSQLLSGPDLTQPMIEVLFQFREQPIGVCADVKEMFCQIKIRPDDQDAQRFVWRDSRSQQIQTFVMTSMLFGNSCSPCSAQYVKNLNAGEWEKTYPEAVKTIIKNNYVDDTVASFATEADAIRVMSQATSILAEGGFELRGFVSNSAVVASKLQNDDSSQDATVVLDKPGVLAPEKILGMHWQPGTDDFVFDLKFHKAPAEVLDGQRIPTKRELLCIVMSIFDPFGLLTPFTLAAKRLMQRTFDFKLEWDQQIPPDLVPKWMKWRELLPAIKRFHVPRCYSPRMDEASDLQLHIFVDASETAYSAAGIWRMEFYDKVELAFIAGKSKCAPRKPLTIPRLELEAARLGVRLKKSILQGHRLKPSFCTFWTDSRIVLSWINLRGTGYSPFVYNRVEEILDDSDASDWRWTPGELNMADDGTRECFLEFDEESRWTRGSEFLKQDPSQWPRPNEMTTPTEEERKPGVEMALLLISSQVSDLDLDITRFSKYLRLVRSNAWLHRIFVKWPAVMKREPTCRGELTAPEIEESELQLCRRAQREDFTDEYAALLSGAPIGPESKIYNCDPFLDTDGLIRVGGRLDLASMVPMSSRNPIILPRDHRFTELLIQRCHELHRHMFHESVVADIQQKYWIPQLRVKVRAVKANCQQCKVDNAKPRQPRMGQLPADRLAIGFRCFTFVGVDLFGPITVTIRRQHEKRWVALFVCLPTGALHLELVEDLSTDAFLLAFRNFMNLRGVPRLMRSDNGTNFVGINKELMNVPDFLDHDQVLRETSGLGIEWLFNTPGDPSAGGVWERLVQTVKWSLRKILQTRFLRIATMRSFLYESMNMINTRPLTHVPVDPEDPEPLTPNHFLLGCVNSTHQPSELSAKPIVTRKQWRLAQEAKQHFWNRWLLEFLPTMLRRDKWHEKAPDLAADQLVFICDKDEPRSQWRMGRILSVTMGKDGTVRSANVQTTKGVLRRPANKLAVLDVQPKDSDGSGPQTGGGGCRQSDGLAK